MLREHLERITPLIVHDSSSDRWDQAMLYRDWAKYASLTGDRIGADTTLAYASELLDTSIQLEREVYGRWLAMVNCNLGDYDAAIADFLRFSGSGEESFAKNVWLGRAYILAGRIGDAIGPLERASTRFDESRFYEGFSSAQVLYYLGRVYEASGWRDRAIEQYEKFLDVWKVADEGIIELEDAKIRLAKLKGQAGNGT